MDAVTSEVVVYWQAIISTLQQRGLLRSRPAQGGMILPEADPILLPDRAIFVLDMQRLGGIAREQWLDRALWAQWRAALQGRRCFVSGGGGLAICVARQPGAKAKRLPRVIPLADDDIPPDPYTVTLGHTRRGPVVLDLAGVHRAILTGGTSGSGKTNFLQSIILQLARKHAPDEFQAAIVDLKEVDFIAFDNLPHLLAPTARSVEDAATLIERVEGERIRRAGLMAQAGVSDWRAYNARPVDGVSFSLLLLIVDEAADLAGTPAMATLIDVARKGRAMGVSLAVGTQSPTSRVIDHQVRANLPTAIAFQCRTDIESRVILGKRGAEALDRKGLALTYIGGRWERVQTLKVDRDGGSEPGAMLGKVSVPDEPSLDGVEADMVRYAVEQLGGAFIIGQLYAQFKGQVSKYAITQLAKQWEQRGWLTEPEHAAAPRLVTRELMSLCPYAWDTGTLGVIR
jgi:hypothetical protein